MADTNASILERNILLPQKLAEFGVQSSLYSRPPAGRNVFMLGKSPGIPGQIYIWPGDEHVELVIHGDKDLRQAVLTVRENARTISRQLTVSSNPNLLGTDKRSRSVALDVFRRNFTMVLPSGTKYSLSKVERVESIYNNRYTATLTAKVPASHLSFLVGQDEVTQFVAQLPKVVDSVEAAHQALRPAGLSKKAVRQGEFFFDPVNKQQLTIIKKALTEREARTRILKKQELEAGSTHRAQELVRLPGVGVFVRGEITDSRTMHHATLNLDEWHRCIRNREVVQTARRRRSWD